MFHGYVELILITPVCYCSFAGNESQFYDSMEISLPKNFVPGSVYAVVSTVGRY